MDIPIIIIAYNNYTYVKNMIKQLENLKFTNIHIIDNNSSYTKLIEFYKTLSNIQIHYMEHNYGPRVLFNPIKKTFYDSLPNYFILTDPDLQLNDNLPENFVEILKNLTDKYKIGKAGFTLDLEQSKFKNLKFRRKNQTYNISQCEEKFWYHPLETDVYLANIDTTFAVYNKKYFSNTIIENIFLKGVRVSGNFKCKHLPWYRDDILDEDERSYYNNRSTCSFWGY